MLPLSKPRLNITVIVSVFKRVHKIAKSCYYLLHVYLVSPSVHMEQFGSQWTGVH